ncbi:hypothetical protein D3C87_1887470 [compost metagenome]
MLVTCFPKESCIMAPSAERPSREPLEKIFRVSGLGPLGPPGMLASPLVASSVEIRTKSAGWL